MTSNSSLEGMSSSASFVAKPFTVPLDEMSSSSVAEPFGSNLLGGKSSCLTAIFNAKTSPILVSDTSFDSSGLDLWIAELGLYTDDKLVLNSDQWLNDI